MHTLPIVSVQTGLRAAREGRGWDQKTLAKESGVDQATISRIEAGKTTNPSNTTVAALEEALGIPRGSLVFGPQAEALAS